MFRKIIVFVIFYLVLPGTALANSYNLTRKLDDILVWILVLIPSVATLMIAYHQLGKLTSFDDSPTEPLDDRVKNILKVSIIAFTITSFIAVIKRYFM